MEVKNSKVMSIQPNGTWEGAYGVMYKFEIVFQNGDVGEYSSKSKDQNKFEQGQETEYEFYGGKFPKIKPHYQKPQGNFSGNKSFGKSDDVQVKIVRQSMLKASVDFHAINPGLKPTEIDIMKTAERFVSFVTGNNDVQLSESFTKQDKDDLPF
ncbi:MAG: hypothetical protein Unbinned6486contig1001_34 [Prokaryotic dsDNA virus sp.]|nr:MAG: hypothetical protein Unbinned6486contig1001_34 [Prokaryotic dsDNA virus sp.]|tara:strand:+ start:8170 stop:8631 length:462 start_codon:yes stop_codon:yes gene_type:complete